MGLEDWREAAGAEKIRNFARESQYENEEEYEAVALKSVHRNAVRAEYDDEYDDSFDEVGGVVDDAGEEEMMSLGHVEGQLRAAAIRRVADVAERHPEYVLSLVRGWMTSED